MLRAKPITGRVLSELGVSQMVNLAQKLYDEGEYTAASDLIEEVFQKLSGAAYSCDQEEQSDDDR